MNHLKLLFIALLFILQGKAQSNIYTSNQFILNLNEKNKQFSFYAKELSLELTISGSYTFKEDSLILTTHKINGETAIFAIYHLSKHQLINLFKQKEFYTNIPPKLYLLKKIHANGSIAQENYWQNFENGKYEKYEFDENKNILAKQNYSQFKLDGKQLIFKGDKQSTISFELNYKNGQLHGKSYYYNKLENEVPQVELLKIEKYKKGILKKTKKPVKQRVFYTNHF